MTGPPTPPGHRPRSVDVAFWCWLVAAVLIVALGLLTLSQATHLVVYATGALLLAAGFGLALIAGRTRRREGRFANAGIGLALALVVFLALLLLSGAGIAVVVVVAVTMVLLIAGSVLIRRGEAARWFGGADR